MGWRRTLNITGLIVYDEAMALALGWRNQ